MLDACLFCRLDITHWSPLVIPKLSDALSSSARHSQKSTFIRCESPAHSVDSKQPPNCRIHPKFFIYLTIITRLLRRHRNQIFFNSPAPVCCTYRGANPGYMVDPLGCGPGKKGGKNVGIMPGMPPGGPIPYGAIGGKAGMSLGSCTSWRSVTSSFDFYCSLLSECLLLSWRQNARITQLAARRLQCPASHLVAPSLPNSS